VHLIEVGDGVDRGWCRVDKRKNRMSEIGHRGGKRRERGGYFIKASGVQTILRHTLTLPLNHGVA
jgi:hypothetical protein